MSPRAFAERVGITGIVLTRVDGDARGGAALSMRAITGKPIKLHRHRREDRRARAVPCRPRSPAASSAWATSSAWSRRPPRPSTRKRPRSSPPSCRRASSTSTTSPAQLRQLRKMGGMGGMLGHAARRRQDQEAARRAPRSTRGILKRQEAIIGVDDQAERQATPSCSNGSRRRRIAAGSGTTVPEINRLLKQYQDMAGMMKRMNKLGQKGLMRHGLSALMPGGGGSGIDHALHPVCDPANRIISRSPSGGQMSRLAPG